MYESVPAERVKTELGGRRQGFLSRFLTRGAQDASTVGCVPLPSQLVIASVPPPLYRAEPGLVRVRMAARRLRCVVASRASALATCAIAASAMRRSPIDCSNSSEPWSAGDRRGNHTRRKRERSEPEEEEQPVNPCAEFNTLKWRMSYASRK